jgi:hypothetical protein
MARATRANGYAVFDARLHLPARAHAEQALGKLPAPCGPSSDRDASSGTHRQLGRTCGFARKPAIR